MTGRPVVFISCGQFTAEEKQLGQQVCEIVRSFGYEPYFAENQNSLRGLNENILSKLNECVGLVAIMHQRGTVSFDAKGNGHVRGSVWIEQEIAIAAFIAKCLNRRIEVAVFLHGSIKREGLRELLHLNPFVFSQEQEVLNRLPEALKQWSVRSSHPVEVVTVYKTARKSSEQHDYQLEVGLRNNGDSRVGTYQVEVEFPAIFLSLTNSVHSMEIGNRRTATHRMFRVTEMHYTDRLILPGDTKRVLVLDYSINDDIYRNAAAMLETFTVRVRVENEPPQELIFKITDFQNF
jgi:hypothetical protein